MPSFTNLVIASRWEHIEKILLAMQQKARKLGVQPITYYHESVNSPVYVYQDSEGFRYSHEDPPDIHKAPFTGMVLDRIRVVVTGEAPQFDGWRFVAKLAPTTDRQHNILMTLPDYSNPDALKPYVDKVGLCEHCNTSRRRNETFVVEKEGVVKAVGRACLKDFVGGKTPEQVIAMGVAFFDIPSTISDYDKDYFNGPAFIPTVGLLAMLAGTVRYIQEYGFVSKKEANDYGGLSTSDRVWDHFCGRNPMGEVRPVITEEDWEKAKLVRDFMSTMSGGSEYCINLRTLSTQETVSPSSRGIVASAVHSWRKSVSEKLSAPQIDEYYGEKDKTYTETVTLASLILIPGYYGMKVLHAFVTEKGHRLTWFASGGGSQVCTDEDKEQKFQIEFKVKEHSVYNGKKQTVIYYVKTSQPAER